MPLDCDACSTGAIGRVGGAARLVPRDGRRPGGRVTRRSIGWRAAMLRPGTACSPCRARPAAARACSRHRAHASAAVHAPAAHLPAPAPARTAVSDHRPGRGGASARAAGARGRHPRRTGSHAGRASTAAVSRRRPRTCASTGAPPSPHDADRRGAGPRRGSSRASHSSAAPGNCSTRCWRPSARRSRTSTSPTSSTGGPPGNRTPTPQEAQVCRPFLERQVELVAPEVVVLLGGAAAKHMLDVRRGHHAACGASGATSRSARTRRVRSPRCIPRISCARRPPSVWRGGIC